MSGVSTDLNPAPVSSPRPAWPRGTQALAHRNFRLFIAGQLVSVIGSWMQSVAQAWFVYRLTGSELLLGLIGFADRVPVFLLGIVGGMVADRFDRHRVVIVTQIAGMAQALAMGLLIASDAPSIPLLFALAALQGVINAFDLPARQSFIASMVPPAELHNALALNSSVFNAARVIGPAIAGVVVALAGEASCFFLNALSYTAVLLGLLKMSLPPRRRDAASMPAGAMALEGMRYAASSPPVRSLLALLGVVSLCGVPCMVLMPVFAGSILGGGPRTLGTLVGSCGVGAFLAAAVLARRPSVRGLGRVAHQAAAGFGVSLVLFAFSRSYPISLLLLLSVGFFMILQAAATNQLLQSIVPDGLRGRVMSLYTVMFIGMGPWGSLLAGWIADVAGAPVAVALGGIACVAGGVIFALAAPALGSGRVDTPRSCV